MEKVTEKIKLSKGFKRNTPMFDDEEIYKKSKKKSLASIYEQDDENMMIKTTKPILTKEDVEDKGKKDLPVFELPCQYFFGNAVESDEEVFFLTKYSISGRQRINF